MSEQASKATSDEAGEGPIPPLQRFYDNIWLLFVLSMVVVLGFYLAWGLIDLALVPPSR